MACQSKRMVMDEQGNERNNKRRKGGWAAGGGGDGDVFVAPDGFTIDLVDIVFSHLPVLSAARMSLVSSRYRNLWKHCKNMIFDKSVVGGVENLEVMRVVQLAMNWHRGRKIDKFSICTHPPFIRSVLDDWIEIALAKNVEEIELDYSPSHVPRPLREGFSEARSVRTLKLINVKLEKPQKMQPWAGMTSLRKLKMRNCALNCFDEVFSCCFQLEYLEILKCKRVDVLRLPASKHKNFTTLKVGGCEDLVEIQINAPTLKSFYYQGSITRIEVQGIVPQLERVFVSYIPAKWIIPENLITKLMVGSATNLRVLTLNSVFIEVMSKVFQQRELEATSVVFPSLTELQIYMENYSCRSMGDLRYILESCPRLDTLHIDMTCCQYEGTKISRMLEKNITRRTNPQQFRCLETIKIKGFKSSQYEHDLLEYLVTKSVALQTLALVSSQGSIWPNIQSPFLQHIRFIALTPLLKISIYDHNDDRSCISPSHTKTWYLA